jgi:hypothetical protein
MASMENRLFDKMEHEAQRRGVLEALRILIRGTKELTDWKPEVGKRADRISYKHPVSNRVMIGYGWSDSHELQKLIAIVNMRNNQFGSVFEVGKDDVYERLRSYLPQAVKGILTRGEDFVPIEDKSDAEQFLAFLRSFVGKGEE